MRSVKTNCLPCLWCLLPPMTLYHISLVICHALTFMLFDITFYFCLSTSFSSPGVGSEVLEKSICVSLTTRRLPIKHIKTYTIKEGSMKAVM